MNGIYAQSWFRGGMAGLVCGLVVTVAGSFGLAERFGAGEIVFAFASVPVWVTMRFPWEISESVITIAVLLYWAFLGMLIGYLGSRGKAGIVALLFLFMVLCVGHLNAKKAIEADIEQAIEAFIASFQTQ